MTKTASLGQIIVRRAGETDKSRDLRLHFTDEVVFVAAKRKLQTTHGIEVVDAFFGYQIFADAFDAVATAEIFFKS